MYHSNKYDLAKNPRAKLDLFKVYYSMIYHLYLLTENEIPISFEIRYIKNVSKSTSIKVYCIHHKLVAFTIRDLYLI